MKENVQLIYKESYEEDIQAEKERCELKKVKRFKQVFLIVVPVGIASSIASFKMLDKPDYLWVNIFIGIILVFSVLLVILGWYRSFYTYGRLGIRVLAFLDSYDCRIESIILKGYDLVICAVDAEGIIESKAFDLAGFDSKFKKDIAKVEIDLNREIIYRPFDSYRFENQI